MSGRSGLAIIGGPNGCGKSTLARHLAGTDQLFGAIPINPDDLTREVTTRSPPITGDGANLVGVERAEKAVWKAIASGASAAVETVLSSPKYLDVVDAADRRGYLTRLHFVTLPTVDLALERIATRVAEGGHDVPEDRVRARWKRAHDNLVTYLERVHEVFVYANLDGEPELVLYGVDGKITSRATKNVLPEVTRRLLRG